MLGLGLGLWSLVWVRWAFELVLKHIVLPAKQAEDDDQERGEKFRRMSISNDTSARKVSFGGEDVMEIGIKQ